MSVQMNDPESARIEWRVGVLSRWWRFLPMPVMTLIVIPLVIVLVLSGIGDSRKIRGAPLPDDRLLDTLVPLSALVAAAVWGVALALCLTRMIGLQRWVEARVAKARRCTRCDYPLGAEGGTDLRVRCPECGEAPTGTWLPKRVKAIIVVSRVLHMLAAGVLLVAAVAALCLGMWGWAGPPGPE